MPFQKGKSGSPEHQMKKGQTLNPNGRPKKLPELDKLLADVLGEEKDGLSAAEVILKALRIKATKGDIRAAEILLERAYGKAKQTIDNNVRNITPVIINWKPIDDIEDAIQTNEETMGGSQPIGEE
jgi:hypothetical protein